MFPILRPRPGSTGWGDFCIWVRTYLRVEEGTGYVVYRPKAEGYFTDEAAMSEWNSGFANQPVRVHRAGRAFSYIRVDGAAADWGSVRAALGLTSASDLDVNSLLPAPGSVSDADRVRYYGLEYCLLFEFITRKAELRKVAQFQAAVEKWAVKLEQQYGLQVAEMAAEMVRKQRQPRRVRTRFRPAPASLPNVRPGPPMDVSGRVRAPRSLDQIMSRSLKPEEIYDVPTSKIRVRKNTAALALRHET
jgi:hypothetical protein